MEKYINYMLMLLGLIVSAYLWHNYGSSLASWTWAIGAVMSIVNVIKED